MRLQRAGASQNSCLARPSTGSPRSFLAGSSPDLALRFGRHMLLLPLLLPPLRLLLY